MTGAMCSVGPTAGRHFRDLSVYAEEDFMDRPLLSERPGLLAGSDPRS